jgi:hypothetical protein
MVKGIEKIAERLGAKVICQVPDVGGGAFGMARLAGIIDSLQARLRPTETGWVHHPKVPMSEQTQRALEHLAERVSTPERKISPMQLAAQLLEEAVERLVEATDPPRE